MFGSHIHLPWKENKGGSELALCDRKYIIIIATDMNPRYKKEFTRERKTPPSMAGGENGIEVREKVEVGESPKWMFVRKQ